VRLAAGDEQRKNQQEGKQALFTHNLQIY
jgi:hypothetical protein